MSSKGNGSLTRTGEERTSRAQILDAAIQRFAADGLDASLRSVAGDAGVSAGLIIHHFDSRDGLLTACDQEVLAITRTAKAALISQGAGEMLTQMAQAEQYGPAVGYVLRRLQAGGTLATKLVEDFIADAEDYLADGERAGIIRPSRDPGARARLLTEMSLGALLLQMPGRGDPLDVTDLPRLMAEHTERIVLPFLELTTEPLLTDSTMLEALIAQRAESADTAADPAASQEER